MQLRKYTSDLKEMLEAKLCVLTRLHTQLRGQVKVAEQCFLRTEQSVTKNLRMIDKLYHQEVGSLNVCKLSYSRN